MDPSNREAKSLLDDILKEERKKGAKDLYMILGVSRNSSIEEIRRGFKKLAAKWHPDKNNQTEEKKIFAEKKFKEINSAYTILIDPYKREIYDKTGKDENIEQKYKPEEKSVFDEIELEKLKESENAEKTFKYTIRRSDIDVNGHMHNTNYLSLAYEALPEDIYNNTIFDNFEILYKKEIKYGETVNFFYSFENNIHTISIKSEDDKILHSIIKLY